MISDTLSALITRAARIEEEIADLDTIVSQRKEALAQIMEEDIPSVLHENGLLSAPLADGRTVTIEQTVTVSQQDKAMLCDWLELHGYGAVIKTELDFGKGADMEEIEAYLRASGQDYHKSVEVHSMTLKKVVREHIEAGGEYPPPEAARVSIFERAKIKGGKV